MSDDFRTNWKGLGNIATTPSLSIGARLLLVILLKYAGIDGKCFASQEQLAIDIGCVDRTIRTYLTELKAAKLVDWSRKTFNGSSYYNFNVDVYSRNDNTNKSAHTGNSQPLHNGSTDPDNNVSKYVNESSKLQQQLESYTGRKLTPKEGSHFEDLVAQNGAECFVWALDKIKKTGNKDIHVNYLQKVMDDYTPPPPIHRKCGKCNNGWIIPAVQECQCTLKHRANMKAYKVKHGL